MYWIRYAGSGVRDHIDNADPLEAGLVNPSSITMDDKTGDIYLTAQQLGHADIRNTMIYAKATEEKQKLAAELLD